MDEKKKIADEGRVAVNTAEAAVRELQLRQLNLQEKVVISYLSHYCCNIQILILAALLVFFKVFHFSCLVQILL
jgi:hypothetical protein